MKRGKPLKRGGKLKPVGQRGKRRRADYDAYMRSPEWKAVRRAVLDRDKGCTQASGDCRGVLTCHHTSYTYWKREMDGLHSVVTLCEAHHALIDGWKHR